VNRGLQAEFPDFEAVYHLVIDAVDTYNEGWERSFKDQELLKVITMCNFRRCALQHCVTACCAWALDRAGRRHCPRGRQGLGGDQKEGVHD
jgi:hypothetical protein